MRSSSRVTQDDSTVNVAQLPKGQSGAIQANPVADLGETRRVDSLVRNNLAQGLQTQAAAAPSKTTLPSSDEITARIARCVGIWETNRGEDNPNPRESEIDTVSGINGSMATIEQATMPYAIDALKRNKGLRDQATPVLTLKELTAANDRCVAVATLLKAINKAAAEGVEPDIFIQNNTSKIDATGLGHDDVRTMFSAVELKETIDQVHTSKMAAAKNKRAKVVQDGIAAIPEADRLGLGAGSLKAYIDKPEKWGENRVAWQRKAVNLMANDVGSRIEAVAESSNGTALAIPVIKARVDAELAKKPVPSLEDIVKTVAQKNNPNENNYGLHVWQTYDRLY
jgi:hypothetical protein